MFKFLFFIFILSYSSLLIIVFRVFKIHNLFRCCSSIYRSYIFLFLTVFSFLYTFAISIIGQYLSDRTMIAFFGLSMFVFYCVTNRWLLEDFEDHPIPNSIVFLVSAHIDHSHHVLDLLTFGLATRRNPSYSIQHDYKSATIRINFFLYYSLTYRKHCQPFY